MKRAVGTAVIGKEKSRGNVLEEFTRETQGHGRGTFFRKRGKSVEPVTMAARGSKSGRVDQIAWIAIMGTRGGGKERNYCRGIKKKKDPGGGGRLIGKERSQSRNPLHRFARRKVRSLNMPRKGRKHPLVAGSRAEKLSQRSRYGVATCNGL